MTKRISQLDATRTVDEPETEPRVITLGSEDAELVFDALGSETSRALFQALIEQPRTASALADEIDASIQTVSYHLQNLDEAALIRDAGTRYSDRGREMVVWAAVNDSVLVAGDHRDTTVLRERLAAVLGLGVLGVAVQAAVRWVDRALTPGVGSVQPASNAPDPGLLVALVRWVAAELAAVDVGLAVFLGGLAVLLMRWYGGSWTV